jgi:hypothetical protein
VRVSLASDVATVCQVCRAGTDGDRLVATRSPKSPDLQDDLCPVWALQTVRACKSARCWDSNLLHRTGNSRRRG